eukprot:CAMPEP_0204353050 /NCGR_PEP_ID=MMETSP0469-20131031/32363_1 /ASSEMBLY_ACC=CAM_ASM_000384 /TAXON_ID=2969 /ORGANISM="Oxyrrhis marina" /LENGTH=221 /DNA_ID=CAMNT_0051339893 /DNA_START=27 /DNA_END=693 /DNA_ORIENTATION=-
MAKQPSDLEFSLDEFGHGITTVLRENVVKVTFPNGGSQDHSKKAGEIIPLLLFEGLWRFETDSEAATVYWSGTAWTGLRVESKAAPVLDYLSLRRTEKGAYEEIQRLLEELKETEQQISEMNARADDARKDLQAKAAAHKVAEEEARKRQAEAKAAAEVVKQIDSRRQAVEAKRQDFHGALMRARDVLSEEAAKATAERAEEIDDSKDQRLGVQAAGPAAV